MAYHLHCVEPEPIPPKPLSDHGAVSNYHRAHVMHNTAPFYRLSPDPDTREDDILPLHYVHTPQFMVRTVHALTPDPELCLTPEKPECSFRDDTAIGVKSKERAVPRARQHVRFDVEDSQSSTDSERTKLPRHETESPNIDENDLEIINVMSKVYLNQSSESSPEPEVTQPKTYPYCFQDSNEPDIPSHQTKTYTYTTTEDNQASARPKPIKPFTDTDGSWTHKKGYKFPFRSEPNHDRRQDESSRHVLARPEYNTTLHLKQRMDQLKTAEIDINAGVKQKLKTSPKTKELVKEKATQKLNVKRSQVYQGALAPMDVPVDDLLAAVAKEKREKSAKLKKAASAKSKAKDGQGPPDLMEFFSPDLQWESGGWTMTQPPPQTNQLRTATQEAAFDVYRHIRCWHNL